MLLVQRSLSETVEQTAAVRAQQVVDRVAGNYTDDVKRNAIDGVDSLVLKTELVQVLVDYSPVADGSPDYKVEGSTEASGPVVPISAVRPVGDAAVLVPNTHVTDAKGKDVHVALAVAAGSTKGRPFVVLFAVPLADVDAAASTVLRYLLLGVPLLILVAGAATYLFAGRALRPVEAIRAQVAEMSEKDLAQRVPVPAARDEVGRLAETMNAMISRLEDAQGVQRRFVADASHELRSPLSTITAGLELLHRDTTDPATVTTLLSETERLGNLVDALLLLARADERGLQPRRDEVDLDEIAEAERIRPGGDGVPTQVRAEPIRVIGDRGQLVRVVRNLVDNARRHAASRVSVTVSRHEEIPEIAVIDVADDGPGVPEADRTRIFERFVRLDDARARADGGSGLGLAIVAEVVAAHGGEVEVLAAPDGGALFRVLLPAAVQPLPGDVEASHPTMSAVPAAPPAVAEPDPPEVPDDAPEAPTAPYEVPTPTSPSTSTAIPEGPTVPQPIGGAPKHQQQSRPPSTNPQAQGPSGPEPSTPPTGTPAVSGRRRARDVPGTPPHGQPRQPARRPTQPPAGPTGTPAHGVPVAPGRSPWLQAPVTDAQAKLDPPTAPWRIPARPDAPDTDPHGVPVQGRRKPS